MSTEHPKLSGFMLTIMLTVLAGGIAWGAASAGAATASKEIQDLKEKLDRHLTTDNRERVLQAERFGRIETLLAEVRIAQEKEAAR